MAVRVSYSYSTKLPTQPPECQRKLMVRAKPPCICVPCPTLPSGPVVSAFYARVGWQGRKQQRRRLCNLHLLHTANPRRQKKIKFKINPKIKIRKNPRKCPSGPLLHLEHAQIHICCSTYHDSRNIRPLTKPARAFTYAGHQGLDIARGKDTLYGMATSWRAGDRDFCY